MSRTLIAFLNAAKRWDIADELWAGRCELADGAPGLWIGRRPDGSTAEIAIELGIADPATVEHAVTLVEGAFGRTVADIIRGAAQDADIDVTVERDPVLHSPHPLPGLPGEPGVPAATRSGRFDVPLAVGTAQLVLRFGRLVVTIPRAVSETGDDWVRVSDSDSGVMLALGPVIESDEHNRSEIPFGFEVAAEELHISVSPDPTLPVGTRIERRQRWATALADQAEKQQRWRPAAAKSTADRVADIATSIGDEQLVDRAQQAADRAQRRRRWRFAAAILAGVGLLALLVVAPRVSGPQDPQPPGTFYENCDAARRAGAAPILRGEPGYRSALDRDNDGIACEI